MATIQMSYEEWFEKFKPVKNHLDDNASYDGCMYETFGAEVAHVRERELSKIWTLIDLDGREYVSEGYHHVNRMGYFITEVAYDLDHFYNVPVLDDAEYAEIEAQYEELNKDD